MIDTPINQWKIPTAFRADYEKILLATRYKNVDKINVTDKMYDALLKSICIAYRDAYQHEMRINGKRIVRGKSDDY